METKGAETTSADNRLYPAHSIHSYKHVLLANLHKNLARIVIEKKQSQYAIFKGKDAAKMNPSSKSNKRTDIPFSVKKAAQKIDKQQMINST